MRISVKTVYHINGVYIRMIVDRKVKSKKLFTIEKKFFKAGRIIASHQNALQYNHIISQAEQEWNEKALNIQSGRVQVDNTLNPIQEEPDKLLSSAIIDYAKRVKQLGKYKSYRKYRNIAGKVVDHKDIKDGNHMSSGYGVFDTRGNKIVSNKYEQLDILSLSTSKSSSRMSRNHLS